MDVIEEKLRTLPVRSRTAGTSDIASLQDCCTPLGLTVGGKQKAAVLQELVTAIQNFRNGHGHKIETDADLQGWFQNTPVEVLEEKMKSLPISRKKAPEPFMSLQDWCQALDVPFRSRDTAASIRVELLRAIRRVHAHKEPYIADEQALRTWLQKQPLEVLKAKLHSLPHGRNKEKKDFMSLEDWCQTLEVPFKRRSRADVETSLFEAIRRMREGGHGEDLGDEGAFRRWLKEVPLHHLEARMQHLHTHNGNGPFTSFREWCQTLGIATQWKSRPLMMKQIKEAVQRLQAQNRGEFADHLALRAWLERQPLDVLKEKLQSLPLTRTASEANLASLKDWCQAIGVDYEDTKASRKMRQEVFEAIERLQTTARQEFVDERALLTWLGKQSLDFLEAELGTLVFRSRSAKKSFFSLEDWCRTVGVPFRGRQKEVLHTEFLAAMKRRQTAINAEFADPEALMTWLQTAPIDVVQEKLEMLPHYRRRQGRDIMSVEDWCQAMRVNVKGRPICELISDMLRVVSELQTEKRADFADEQALRNWWEKESLDILRGQLRSIPRSQKHRRRNLMCLEDWRRVLHTGVMKRAPTNEDMEEETWKALLAHRLLRHEAWRSRELEDLATLPSRTVKALLCQA